jgi:hypothetical protein
VEKSVVDGKVVAVIDAGEVVGIAVSNEFHAVARREEVMLVYQSILSTGGRRKLTDET